MIAASAREAARQAGGTATRGRYAVLVFEHQAPWRGGQGVRVTPMDVEPSMLSSVEDAIAWYGDTAVPVLADTSGFCVALLYADRASGRVISETVWQDPRALAASRSAAAAGEAAAACCASSSGTRVPNCSIASSLVSSRSASYSAPLAAAAPQPSSIPTGC